MFPYSRQSINSSDIKSVVGSLKSNFLTQGPLLSKFEKKISKFVNAKFSVGTNSATSALHIACMSLGLKKGEIIWTVNNSFLASASCGLFCDAKVDLIDIDLKNYNISIEDLKKKLKLKKKKNKLPKVIIPVNFAGLAYNQKELFKLKKKYKFKIIEDSSHALGSKYENYRIGGCKFSDISVFSFHAVKTITTGEGGMATTNDRKLFEKMKLLRNHGLTRDKKLLKNKNLGFWYYEKKVLGFNYRMNEMSAALGISQMRRLNKFLKKRRQLALRYNKILDTKKLILPNSKDIKTSSVHLYIIRLHKALSLGKYDYVFQTLRKRGIGVNLHYLPISSLILKKKKINKIFPNSYIYSTSSFSIPLYYDLSFKAQNKIAKIINSVIKSIN